MPSLCRNMFVTQPPTNRIQVRWSLAPDCQPSHSFIRGWEQVVKRPGGVRVEDILHDVQCTKNEIWAKIDWRHACWSAQCVTPCEGELSD